MLLKAGGKILNGGGKFLSITQDSDIVLTFRVRGTCFPSKMTQGRNNTAVYQFISKDNIDNTVYIDYNDGTGEHAYPFKSNGSIRRIDFRNLAEGTTPETIQGSTVYDQNPIHFYQDLPPEVIGTVNETYPEFRDVTIRFEKPQDITGITIDRTRVWGVISSVISKLRGLETLLFRDFAFIDAFAQDFYNSLIRRITLANIGDVMNNGIPDWILNSNNLTLLDLENSVDLSGSPVIKKLSEINKLKDSLVNLNLGGSGINYKLPEELGELHLLSSLDLRGNNSLDLRLPDNLNGLMSLEELYVQDTRIPFLEIERIIQGIPSLELLRLIRCGYNTDYDFSEDNFSLKDIRIGYQQWNGGSVPSFISRLKALERLSIIADNIATVYDGLNSYGDFSACTELNFLSIGRMSNFQTTIPTWFSVLTKLSTMNFQASFQNTGGIDSFVDNFYDFVVAEVSMSVGNTPFRNMNMSGYSNNVTDQNNSTRPSGLYQQPSGYVQGSNNGMPASQMEKIWVLTNQYGHTWTVKPA